MSLYLPDSDCAWIEHGLLILNLTLLSGGGTAQGLVLALFLLLQKSLYHQLLRLPNQGRRSDLNPFVTLRISHPFIINCFWRLGGHTVGLVWHCPSLIIDFPDKFSVLLCVICSASHAQKLTLFDSRAEVE